MKLSHLVLIVAAALAAATAPAQPPELDRTVLPVPEPAYAPITELDARNAQRRPVSK